MHLFRLAIALGLVSILSTATVAHADTEAAYSFTPQEFIANYNARAQHGDDRLTGSKRAGNMVTLVMDDMYFQQGIQRAKELDLANGRYTMDIKIMMKVDKDDHVTSIGLTGTRNDMVNMMRTIGAISLTYDVLNPQSSRKDSDAFISTLGLMRGDNSPDGGAPITQLSKGGVFTCVNQAGNIKFGCVIEPRS